MTKLWEQNLSTLALPGLHAYLSSDGHISIKLVFFYQRSSLLRLTFQNIATSTFFLLGQIASTSNVITFKTRTSHSSGLCKMRPFG